MFSLILAFTFLAGCANTYACEIGTTTECIEDATSAEDAVTKYKEECAAALSGTGAESGCAALAPTCTIDDECVPVGNTTTTTTTTSSSSSSSSSSGGGYEAKSDVVDATLPVGTSEVQAEESR